MVSALDFHSKDIGSIPVDLIFSVHNKQCSLPNINDFVDPLFNFYFIYYDLYDEIGRHVRLKILFFLESWFESKYR